MEAIDEGPQDTIPLVFLHGFLGTALDWEKIITHLSPKRRCIALTLPGHGKSGPPLSFMHAIEMIYSYLETLQLVTFDLLGYSMGGRLAYGLIHKYPNHIRQAFIIGASPGLVATLDASKHQSV